MSQLERGYLLIFVFKLRICAYAYICFTDMENNLAINYAPHLTLSSEGAVLMEVHSATVSVPFGALGML